MDGTSSELERRASDLNFTPSAGSISLKRAADLVVSGVGLLLSSPLLAVIALSVKVDSKGSILFRQNRVGLRGKLFSMYKFRSMYASSAAKQTDALKITDFNTFVFSPPGADPRVTRVGRVLRATSLDELPQLYNVLKGDMSIVGPRPELPELVEQYPPEFLDRHAIRPGITGLAQTKGRSDLTYHDALRYDLDYVYDHSLRRDLAILLRTVVVVLLGKGAR